MQPQYQPSTSLSVARDPNVTLWTAGSGKAVRDRKQVVKCVLQRIWLSLNISYVFVQTGSGILAVNQSKKGIPQPVACNSAFNVFIPL